MPKLVDLNPHWVGNGGPGVTRNGVEEPRREGVGVGCDCPCGCGKELYVPFSNPLDSGPQIDRQGWIRTGDTFETLTLSPSILRMDPGGCNWHGFLRYGEFREC